MEAKNIRVGKRRLFALPFFFFFCQVVIRREKGLSVPATKGRNTFHFPQKKKKKKKSSEI